MVQLWELNVGDCFVADVVRPKLAFEIVDFIIGANGRMEHCLVTPRARRTAEGWRDVKRGIMCLTASPQARVHFMGRD